MDTVKIRPKINNIRVKVSTQTNVGNENTKIKVKKPTTIVTEIQREVIVEIIDGGLF